MKRPISLFAFLLLGGAIAQAQVVPLPQSKPATPPKSSSDQSALATFQKLDKARLAIPANTQARTKAADSAATAAAQVAWTAFDAGRFDEASTWFSRAATLRQEFYATWKAVLNAQMVKANVDSQKRIASSKTAKDRLFWREYGAMLQYSLLSQSQIFTRNNNDTAGLLGVSRRKLTYAQGLLTLAREAKQPAQIASRTLDVANVLDDVAGAQADLAQWDEAEKLYKQAQALRTSLPADTPGRNLAESLREMAVLRGSQGDLAGARRFYEEALALHASEEPLRRKVLEATSPDNRVLMQINELAGEVMMLNNLGLIADQMGDFKAAQQFYDRALQSGAGFKGSAFADVFGAQMRAVTQANVAQLHASQGQLEQAQGELEAVIKIQRQLGDESRASTALANLSGLLYEQGNLELAARYLEQARQIAVSAQDLPRLVGFTLALSSLQNQRKNLPEAARLAQQGLILARRVDNLGWKAEADRTMAAVRLSHNKPDEALKFLEEASQIDKRVGAPLEASYTLSLQGQAREAKGDLPGAIEFYKQSVTLVEGVRSTATSESAFAGVKSNAKIYERLVQALIKTGRGEEAFDYMNRSRSKQLQASLRTDSLRSGNPALQTLFDKAGSLDVRTRTIEGELRAEQAKPDDKRDAGKIRALQTSVASTRGEWRKAVEEIKTVNPSYEKLFTVKPMALSETQRSIPADAAFVMYVPLKPSETGEEQLYIFVVTRESLKIITPQVKAKDLWTRIRAVRRQIAGRQDAIFSRGLKGSSMSDVLGRGGPTNAVPTTPENLNEPSLSANLVALYDMLITPVESEIASKKLLAFIPTELLYYLPMQALAKRQGDDLHFLIEDKELVYLTNADVMKVVQTPAADKATGGLVAYGDPVGANLPSAEQEVKTIAEIFPATTNFQGAQVTKASVTDTHNLDRRVLHFATHGVLDSNDPAHSYILLSPGKSPGDEQLTVGEVWDMPLQKVDLVVLSACNTALGERDPNGSELTTLAEAFSSAGANTVLASLWSVSDDSTKDLMVEFYRQLAAGQTKSAALRTAQLSVMKDPKYRHPYFWAPFVLMGDWR